MTGGGWTAQDQAAVRAVYRELREEDPTVAPSTAHRRAQRSYYSRTGRLPTHGLHGYGIGCRCRTCRAAAAEFWRTHPRPSRPALREAGAP